LAPVVGAAAAALVLGVSVSVANTSSAAAEPGTRAGSGAFAVPPGQTTDVILDSVVSASLGRGSSTGSLRFDVRNTVVRPPVVEPQGAGCVGAAGSATVTCSLAPIAADGSATVTLGRADAGGLGRWTLRSIDGSTVISDALPAR